MITKAQAVAAQYRKEFHHVSMTNADGTPMRARVNGRCKTWKRDPDAFQLPMKHGLKDTFYITEMNQADWIDPRA